MKHRHLVIGLAIAATASSFAVVRMTNISRGEGSGLTQPKPTPTEEDVAVDLELYVRGLALDIGQRTTRRKGTIPAAIDWVGAQLENIGYQPTYDEWTSGGERCANIQVEFPGTLSRSEIVVIGTHYDSYRTSPSAQATAGPVAAMLVLLERLRGKSFERTTRFVFFANGEHPHRGTGESGAVRYAELAKAGGENIVAMVCVGSLGAFYSEPETQDFPFPLNLAWPATGDFIAVFGNPGSRKLITQSVNVWKQSSKIPIVAGALPSWFPGMQRSDHDAFEDVGYPAVLISDTGESRYDDIRTVYDQFHRLEYLAMARVVLDLEKFVTSLVRQAG